MKKSEAKKHLGKFWKKMHRHFKNFFQNRDQEDLHQFRVQVKKIKSFLTLLGIKKRNDNLLKLFKPVKKIFKSAGVIRDAYLHQQQANDHNIKQTEFYKEQQLVQENETEKLKSKGNKHLHKMKKIQKKLKKTIHAISNKEIKSFYSTQVSDTQQLLIHHNFSEQLHDGRKMLKHLMYNEKVITKKTTHALSLNFTYIDELQDLLGKWHDNKLALAFFENQLDEKDIHSMQTKSKDLEDAITKKTDDFEKKVHAENHLR